MKKKKYEIFDEIVAVIFLVINVFITVSPVIFLELIMCNYFLNYFCSLTFLREMTAFFFVFTAVYIGLVGSRKLPLAFEVDKKTAKLIYRFFGRIKKWCKFKLTKLKGRRYRQ